MKKKNLGVILGSVALTGVAALSAVMFTGCSNKKLTVNFYDRDLNLISTSQYDYENSDNSGNAGVNNKKIVAPEAPIITGYINTGWYFPCYGDGYKNLESTRRLWNPDENVWFGSDSSLNFVAAYELSDNGWNYDGQERNAFLWTGSQYASPAIQLVQGENYVRFDKTTTEYALKYCKVFENGSDNLGHIENVQIFDNKAFLVEDIDLSLNVWENQTLQANKTGSFVIKITTTKAFEAGILIGADIS